MGEIRNGMGKSQGETREELENNRGKILYMEGTVKKFMETEKLGKEWERSDEITYGRSWEGIAPYNIKKQVCMHISQ